MNRAELINAFEYIDDRYLDAVDAAVQESIIKYRSRRKVCKRIIAVAAVIAMFLALGIAAYATDFLGMRALLLGRGINYGGEAYDTISMTQPQELSKETDPDIARKINTVKTAWAEWEKYTRGGYDSIEMLAPDFYKNPPEGMELRNIIKNEDGSYTACYQPVGCELSETAPEGSKELSITAEDFRAFRAFEQKMIDLTTAPCPEGYDCYSVHSEADAAKLEKIAEKYGLNLRRETNIAWSSDTCGQCGENYYTNEELARLTADIGRSGNIFCETPAGFDKVYWYGEGSFCVSYYFHLPSGEQAVCYGVNSMYSTLAGVWDAVNLESGLSAFTQRTHAAPDGTKLTILSDGRTAYIYAYLENSYFTERISGAQRLSDADIDAVADALRYSLIGK